MTNTPVEIAFVALNSSLIQFREEGIAGLVRDCTTNDLAKEVQLAYEINWFFNDRRLAKIIKEAMKALQEK